MKDPSDTLRLLISVLFAAWVISFAYSFFVFATAFTHVPESSGGAGSVEGFLGWQGVAGLLSVAIFGVRRNWSRRSTVRRLAVLPMTVTVAGFVAIVLIVLWTLLE